MTAPWSTELILAFTTEKQSGNVLGTHKELRSYVLEHIWTKSTVKGVLYVALNPTAHIAMLYSDINLLVFFFPLSQYARTIKWCYW